MSKSSESSKVPSKGLTLRMSTELHTKLKIECVKRDISIQEFIVSLIRKELKTEEKSI